MNASKLTELSTWLDLLTFSKAAYQWKINSMVQCSFYFSYDSGTLYNYMTCKYKWFFLSHKHAYNTLLAAMLGNVYKHYIKSSFNLQGQPGSEKKRLGCLKLLIFMLYTSKTALRMMNELWWMNPRFSLSLGCCVWQDSHSV